MTKERGITYSGPMIRALIAKNKTQTRRLAKLNASGRVSRGGKNWHVDDPNAVLACPYGVVGDRLWARETHAIRPSTRCVAYRADGECGAWGDDGGGGRLFVRHGGIIGGEWNRPDTWRGQSFGMDAFGGKWRSPRFTPRWASRLLHELTDVRLMRLQDITEADAIAEGTQREHPITCDHKRFSCDEVGCYAHREAFQNLWQSINAKRSPWERNDLVWALTFKPVTE